MAMKPNWFLGYPIKQSDWLDAILADAPDELIRFSPEDLHLTLAFLGPVGEDKARRAWSIAESAPPKAVDVTFGEVKPFGRPSKPSAFSLTITRGRPMLCDALRGLGDEVREAAGLEPERREPRPHITVARPHRKASKEVRDAGIAWARGAAIPQTSLRLDKLALYTWSDDRKRVLFRKVALLDLG